MVVKLLGLSRVVTETWTHRLIDILGNPHPFPLP